MNINFNNEYNNNVRHNQDQKILIKIRCIDCCNNNNDNKIQW